MAFCKTWCSSNVSTSEITNAYGQVRLFRKNDDRAAQRRCARSAEDGLLALARAETEQRRQVLVQNLERTTTTLS